MIKQTIFITPVLFIMLITAYQSISASKLKEMRIVDREFLMVQFLDGEMSRRDDGKGDKAFSNSYHESDADTIKRYIPALNISAAQTVSNWTIKSSDDATYGSTGLKPLNCYRKTKMNGHSERDWINSDFVYEYTYEHILFLKLPQAMQQGKSYTVEVHRSINSDQPNRTITFDINQTVSEAIHINLVGYHTSTAMKSADLYMWLGDGGERNYAAFEGNKIYVYDTKSKHQTEVGTVSFWKKSDSDIGSYNLTRSSVWNADVSSFSTPGTYRLVIDGVGCSQEFTIADTIYHDPFMVSVQGFFYMRIGQDSTGGIWPVPRRPLFIPELSPVNTKVYMTTMHPYHSEWATFSSGDVWDKPNDWVRFKKSGNPTNENAKGGHSDALDWDRHLGHVSSIYDMLLPYILTKGAIGDDNLDIAESGNGIPDIIDEARNEVDFWLNLRDGQGYSHGLTNPNDKNEFFQAAPTAIAAWANAVNTSMLADCFRISGHTNLMNQYRDSAIAAFNYADGLTDKMLDKVQDLGDARIRGKDLRMTAAAFLYNVTGETTYENIVNSECAVTNGTSVLFSNTSTSSLNQVYGVAAYLMTNRTIHFQTLYNNMKASIIYQAKEQETNYSTSRPSRRSTNNATGYFRTAQNVQQTIIAHAVADLSGDKLLFAKALVLEADYGLGRNTMNMIQMTTGTTPLENKRSVIDAYTTGSDDGAPGMHPGHTPYMNLDDWDLSLTMGSPSKLYANCYPSNFKTTWPVDEGYFNTRYVWAHNEFTPQQTMRGKMALYGYLYGISKGGYLSNNVNYIFDPDTKNALKNKIPRFTTRLLDCAGRTIWEGNGNPDVNLITKNIPVASGIFLIEQVKYGKKGVRIIVKQ